jgi:type VI secretion system protein ImpA
LLDIPLLLAPTSEHSLCGEDLEYDADFLQLERDAQGRPERTMGDAMHPAEPPQWRRVEQSSIALLQRSKDLRITHFLLQSALALDGFSGLATSLTLINDLLGQYWPTLYPQLDQDDDNDPTVRINTLSGIACDTNVRLLRESLLTRSRAFGPVSLRAALNASGLQNFADEHLTADALAGALRDTDLAELSAVRSALQEAHSAADAIEHYVSSQVGSAQGVDLSALKQPLKQALRILDEYAPDGTATSMQALELRDAEPLPELSAQRSELIATPASDDVSNRDDVVHSLDRILMYYACHEPSSPLPILLTRAKNLVHADFAAIVRNLIPDGMSQFENLRGPDAE